MPDQIRCPKCEQPRTIDEFNRNAARYSGRDSYCRHCMRAAQRQRSKAPKAEKVPIVDQCSIDGCRDRRRGHGYCNRHLKRFRQYGDPFAGKTYKRTTPAKKRPPGLSLEDSFRWFLPGPPPPEGIPWLWPGPVDDKGYGTIRFEGHNTLAHRICYALFVGEIPDGLIVRHKNDTPLDVNPHNLELGTRVDNVRDRVERGRTHRGPRNPAHGSKHPRAALNEDDIRDIRAAYRTGVRQKTLAERYGITQGAVSGIVNRKTWAHVP